jgi:hypothetical protein
MARRYDSRTTIFSPEGRLYQVEYAMEAISNAGAAIGVLAKDGVVLVAEKKITSKVAAGFALSKGHTGPTIAAGALTSCLCVPAAAARHTCSGRAAGEDVPTRQPYRLCSGRNHR